MDFPWLAAAIFALTYVAVALGGLPGLRLDRTGAAIVGGAAMVAAGVVRREQAYHAIDLATLVLLFGMMLVVGQLRLSGFFRLAGVVVARRARTPHQLLLGLILVSGLLSALFVNDTICLALTPLVLEVARALGVRATPYLIALATASNIGSVATPTGNPQNMLIAARSGIAYADFVASLLPAALVGLGLAFAVISFVYRAELREPFLRAAHPRVRVHGFLMAKALGASLAMLGFFFAGANVSVVAIAAGAALLLTRRVKSGKVLREVDWNLLALFAGLFVVTEGALVSGLSERIFALLHAREAATPAALGLSAAALSNLVSNVPAVMLFVPLVPQLPDPGEAWRVLALASTFAGNLTLLGSIANLIVAEGARRECPLTFAEYLKVGVPLTLLSLFAGLLVLR
ncbi:MAG: anion transporter [Vicinamibacteria bacterium]|nr:anion transporter [Vicinamibacteria bacterium]